MKVDDFHQNDHLSGKTWQWTINYPEWCQPCLKLCPIDARSQIIFLWKNIPKTFPERSLEGEASKKSPAGDQRSAASVTIGYINPQENLQNLMQICHVDFPTDFELKFCRHFPQQFCPVCIYNQGSHILGSEPQVRFFWVGDHLASRGFSVSGYTLLRMSY